MSRSGSRGGGSRGGSSGGGRSRSGSSGFRGGGSSRSSSSSRSYSSGRHYHYYSRSYRVPHVSCLWPIILVALVCAVMFGISKQSLTEVSKSTVQREPLPKSASIETDYFTDEAGWIGSSYKLEQGMRKFYKETGVQPYLYILESGKDNERMTADRLHEFAVEAYDRLFEDEAHYLLVFYDTGDGSFGYATQIGADAKTVMDREADTIVIDYLDRYWTSDLGDEEYFSTVFSKSADRIMSVTRSQLPELLAIIIVPFVIVVAFNWWKRAKAQKNLEAEQTQEILNTPLETIGDKDIDDLEEKYK